MPDPSTTDRSSPESPMQTPLEVVTAALVEVIPDYMDAPEWARRVIEALALRQYGKGWSPNRLTGELAPEPDEFNNRIYVLGYQDGPAHPRQENQ